MSDFNGRVVRLSPAGDTSVLLDTSAMGIFAADLEYLPERGLLIVPTLNDNRLFGYTVERGRFP